FNQVPIKLPVALYAFVSVVTVDEQEINWSTGKNSLKFSSRTIELAVGIYLMNYLALFLKSIQSPVPIGVGFRPPPKRILQVDGNNSRTRRGKLRQHEQGAAVSRSYFYDNLRPLDSHFRA